MKTFYTALTDAELADEFNAGNVKAFEQIYSRYSMKLFLHARKLLKDEVLAEDVVHDIFALLFEKLGKLQLQETISSYLYRSVSNRIISMIRHEKVKGRYLEALGKTKINTYIAADSLLLYKELAAIVDKEIQLLPPRMREAFEMSRKQELSHKEISLQTGTSEATVTKHIYFALKILRGKLGGVTPLVALNVLLWLRKIL